MVCSHSSTPRPKNGLYRIMLPKKMGCTELCGGVHTAQRQTPTQIPNGFCTHFIGLGPFSHFRHKHEKNVMRMAGYTTSVVSQRRSCDHDVWGYCLKPFSCGCREGAPPLSVSLMFSASRAWHSSWSCI